MLNSCVGKLNSDTDIDVGINNLLATVNDYFQADRTYVFEIDRTGTCSSTPLSPSAGRR